MIAVLTKWIVHSMVFLAGQQGNFLLYNRDENTTITALELY